VCSRVKRLVQVAGEDLGDELARVPRVCAEHDATDRIVIGRLRAADEQRSTTTARRWWILT
jgi:hypothetical protein